MRIHDGNMNYYLVQCTAWRWLHSRWNT